MADSTQDAQVDPSEPNDTGTEPGVNAAKDAGQLTPEELLKTVEKAGLKDVFDSVLQEAIKKEADRRVTQAIKTHDEKIKKELEEQTAKQKAEKAKLESQKDMSAEQKKITELEEALKKTTDMFQQFMGKTQKERLTQLKADALKAAGLKPTLAIRILTEDPDKIAAEVAELQKEILDIRQADIDKRIAEQKKPLKGQLNSEAEADAKFKEYWATKNPSVKGTAVEEQIVTKK